jgi:hypothetical protein
MSGELEGIVKRSVTVMAEAEFMKNVFLDIEQ